MKKSFLCLYIVGCLLAMNMVQGSYRDRLRVYYYLRQPGWNNPNEPISARPAADGQLDPLPSYTIGDLKRHIKKDPRYHQLYAGNEIDLQYIRDPGMFLDDYDTLGALKNAENLGLLRFNVVQKPQAAGAAKKAAEHVSAAPSSSATPRVTVYVNGRPLQVKTSMEDTLASIAKQAQAAGGAPQSVTITIDF